jgi:phytoene dehydrogenase-like protein
MTYDVLVVGGGAAGLTAAAYAARAGRSVALFERQARLGGLVQSVNRDGFVFDMGLRAVENAGIVLPMLEELGLRLDTVRSPVSVGIEDDLIRVDSPASLADYRDLLVRTYPERRRRRPDHGPDPPDHARHGRPVRHRQPALQGRDARPPLPVRDAAAVDGPVRRHHRAHQPHVGPGGGPARPADRRPRAQGIIGQHFFKGTPAFFAMSYFSVYLDYLYPRGGTAALMGLLEGYVREHGVDVRTELPIVAVDPEARTSPTATAASTATGR